MSTPTFGSPDLTTVIASQVLTHPAPCWIRPGETGEQYHHPSRKAALEPDDPRDTDWTPPSVVQQLDRPCYYVVCGCCGDGCDDPGECMVYHCKSQTEAEETAATSGWVRTPSGWKCRPCSAGDCGWHAGRPS
ncbi:hypothetical protein [Nonomuraea sp. SYSU D8015]|uniref:hypothetical protein n=1 Tax=Nonomuraea sp. SYSU D8015 TaxID=2593644 RepID=UPI001660F19E|nr:hypothetical protein [Nonomuraea sp. SYSU D8015]